MVNRRLFLGGALSGAATTALGSAPATSLRPAVRPRSIGLAAVPSGRDLVAQAALGGRVGYALADARTGEMLEVFNPLHPLPPASVSKAITCAYGLDRLGPDYRFRTQLVSDGTLSDGRLDGDLWLIGGGDPLFDTDALAGMAMRLREAGVREVTGRLMVSDGILPNVFEIDADQPDHVGYNPAISGLNMNFNRVHFEWMRQSSGYEISMDARSASYSPAVQIARMRVEDRSTPIFTFNQIDGRDQWTVARRALGQDGARWLPVRRPTAYVAEVFQTLARVNGIVLRSVEYASDAPQGGQVLSEHVSERLDDILRGMMRWSTNLTAEVVGLMATRAGGRRPASLTASAEAMALWMQQRLGARQVDFLDHSGLGGGSRVRPQDMTRALCEAGPDSLTRELMREITILDDRGNALADHPVKVVGKTGTLNFVSNLAGFITTPGGRELAFTVFCGDVPRRDALSEAQRERPDGGRNYSGRARILQQRLIRRFAAVHEVA